MHDDFQPHAISNDDFCTSLRKRISAAYDEQYDEKSGNTHGWRLLASPPSVLDGADVAFIGLNPGGENRRDDDDHVKFAMERGSAYVDEIWDGAIQPGTSRLQRQVRALFEGLGVEPQSVLAGNLVPFRSPSWKRLKNKDSSLRFGKSLWSDILKRAKPTLIVGMGHEVFKPLSQILEATNANPTRVGVGWDNVTAVKAIISNGSLVVLPHLSRFSIITRQESADALKALFGEQWQTR